MNIDLNISASAVAWYAAIVSTAGVIVALLNFMADKRRLRVKASHGLLVGVNDDSTKIFISVANIGKRPVSISSVGFTVKGGDDMVLTTTPNLNLPKTLKEGAGVQTWMNHEEFVRVLARGDRAVEDVAYTWCRDSTGKVYRSRFTLKW